MEDLHESSQEDLTLRHHLGGVGDVGGLLVADVQPGFPAQGPVDVLQVVD